MGLITLPAIKLWEEEWIDPCESCIYETTMTYSSYTDRVRDYRQCRDSHGWSFCPPGWYRVADHSEFCFLGTDQNNLYPAEQLWELYFGERFASPYLTVGGRLDFTFISPIGMGLDINLETRCTISLLPPEIRCPTFLNISLEFSQPGIGGSFGPIGGFTNLPDKNDSVFRGGRPSIGPPPSIAFGVTTGFGEADVGIGLNEAAGDLIGYLGVGPSNPLSLPSLYVDVGLVSAYLGELPDFLVWPLAPYWVQRWIRYILLP
jgi:hypothetical protein